MKPGVSTRLVLCLGLLLGSGQTCAAEARGRLEANASAERNLAQAETAGDAVDGGIGKVVEGDGANTAGDTGSTGRSTAGDRNATKPEDGEAGESADGTGEVPVMVGECTGKRFKKCR